MAWAMSRGFACASLAERIATVDGSLLHINPMMPPHPTPFTMLDPGAEGVEEVQA